MLSTFSSLQLARRAAASTCYELCMEPLNFQRDCQRAFNLDLFMEIHADAIISGCYWTGSKHGFN